MHKFILATFLLLFTLSAYSGTPRSCDDLSDDCEFYACIEAQVHCGEHGYPIAYGQKYCQKFERNLDKFSEEGKDWIEKTKICLIDRLNTENEEKSCRSIKEEAFDDHLPCYYQSGYCDLPKSDQRAIVKVILTSLWRPRVIATGIKLKKLCRRK